MRKRREIPKNFIQDRLDEAGMSQASLSRITGIMPSVISSIVRGRLFPFRGYIEKICKALNCQPLDIVEVDVCQEGSENKVGNSIANIYISTCTVPNNTISTCTLNNNINSNLNNTNLKGTDNNNKTCTGRGTGETKKVNKQNDYTQDFEKFWSLYPRQIEKKSAFEKWNATLRKGVKPEALITGAMNYARKCFRERTEEKFIKHPKTFLGHNEYWREYQNAEKEAEEYGQDYFNFEDKPSFSD